MKGSCSPATCCTSRSRSPNGSGSRSTMTIRCSGSHLVGSCYGGPNPTATGSGGATSPSRSARSSAADGSATPGKRRAPGNRPDRRYRDLRPSTRCAGRSAMHRVVIALGGNALLRRGAPDTYDEMYAAARTAAERIADVAAAGWEAVLTHGNGPQVGRILMQQEAAAKQVHPMPLDVCGAESQGQIGYLLQVTIGDVFFERGTERPVTTILTLTRVRPQDPAFRNPTKFVGPYLT